MSDGHEDGHAAAAPHVADSHDLIRVHGARENNLKDVSVEIPKRRLTVFTGVSGSGKSSLVFGTIAAESQRLINETYSAFVQGFMPTLARPEVDVLDGLTTAIIVDQERMGANPRSTVGTATDANAMLRILFSRLGQPHIGPPSAFSFNVPSVTGERRDHRRARRRRPRPRRRPSTALGGMCPRCEGRGSVTDFDLTALYDDSKSLNEGALTIPGYSMDGWYGRIFRGCGFFDPDKPIRKFTKKELHDLLYKEPTKIKVDGHQPHLRGADPEDPEVDAVQGRRRAAAAHPRLRGAGGDLHDLPRLRRHPAQRGGPVVEDRRASTSPTPARCRSATWPSGCAASTSRRWRRCWPALRHTLDSFVGDRAGLPLARPAVGHAVGRRGAAHQDDPPPRLVAHRRHLRLRRADHRAAPARHPADERPAAAAARQGQHRARRRAQAGDDRDRRPRRRPRPRRRHRRRRGRASRAPSRGCGPAARSPAGTSTTGPPLKHVGAHAVRRAGGPRRRPRTTCSDVDVDIPLGVLVVVTGVAGSGKSSLIHGSVAGRDGRGVGRPGRRSAARGAATRRPTPACSTRSARRSRRPTA